MSFVTLEQKGPVGIITMRCMSRYFGIWTPSWTR